MMKKLITLVLVVAFAAPVLADDLIPPPQNPETGVGDSWRGDPGSTYYRWEYNDPCLVYGGDPPEVSSFVTHPDKLDPEPLPWGDGTQLAGQFWAENGDPCVPSWYNALPGERQGGVQFEFGSWDVANFIHDQPYKDFWLQITYYTGPESTPMDWEFGMGASADPCGDPTMGGWEGPTSDWTGPLPEWSEIYEEPVDPCDPCGPTEEYAALWDVSLDEWDPLWPDPTETSSPEPWADGELVSQQVLDDDWIHEVWAGTLSPNPEYEWIEGGWGSSYVLIDQVVIETLCYVPEPATMMLLGLGSLLMIRRKR